MKGVLDTESFLAPFQAPAIATSRQAVPDFNLLMSMRYLSALQPVETDVDLSNFHQGYSSTEGPTLGCLGGHSKWPKTPRGENQSEPVKRLALFLALFFWPHPGKRTKPPRQKKMGVWLKGSSIYSEETLLKAHMRCCDSWPEIKQLQKNVQQKLQRTSKSCDIPTTFLLDLPSNWQKKCIF